MNLASRRLNPILDSDDDNATAVPDPADILANGAPTAAPGPFLEDLEVDMVMLSNEPNAREDFAETAEIHNPAHVYVLEYAHVDTISHRPFCAVPTMQSTMNSAVICFPGWDTCMLDSRFLSKSYINYR